MPKMSSLSAPQDVIEGELLKSPPRSFHSDQESWFQYLCRYLPSRARPTMSIRPSPQDMAASSPTKSPPRSSVFLPEGCQLLPSQNLWAALPLSSTVNRSMRPSPQDAEAGEDDKEPLRSSKYPYGSKPDGTWYLCHCELSGAFPKASRR